MIDLREALDAIAAAPPGPEVAAYFDLDGTIIDGYTAAVIYKDRIRQRDVGPLELGQTVGLALDMRLRGADLDALASFAVRSLEGRQEEDLEEWGERLFRNEIASMVFPGARRLVEAHQRAGHRVVMATSATMFQAGPVARDLGFDAILCTRHQTKDGMLTGLLDGGSLWGPAKARAVVGDADASGVALAKSFGYSNGAEDVPLLDAVGRPCALNPDGDMTAEALRRDWPILRLDPPRRGYGLVPVLRTGAAVASLVSTIVASAGVGLALRDRAAAINLAGALGPDLALLMAGVRLDVSGREHLTSRRPAVFMFNHQSGLDLAIVGSLVRRDLTGVAKVEARRDPRFAAIGALLDVAYVDRSNTTHAKAALEPAVEKLRDGVSLVIAPEGTRSPTPRLGRFKKGGFHVALAADVPIVPIVIRNAGELMWRNSLVAHSGTVEVAVLPPIETGGYGVADIDKLVDEVRTAFEATLRAWPGTSTM